MIGRLLAGRWRVHALIGQGGMASVYRATHRNGRAVALKVLRPDLARDDRARSRFLREGYIANRVGHPGAVAVLDEDVTEDGLVFLVMDFLQGETLEQHCVARGGQLPAGEVLAVADALLDILESAHGRGIVHRDIKPANLFLVTTGELKLLDFGIARAQEVGLGSVTRSGVLLGTPGYLAPEQARGRWDEVDARTDLWAVGATMYRALTGKSPHLAATPNEAVIAAATQPVPSLRFACPTLPSGIFEIVDTALRARPEERWQTAADMRSALHAAQGQHGTFKVPRPVSPSAHDTADETPSPSAEPWPRVAAAASARGGAWRSPTTVALATIGLIGAGILIVMASLRAGPPISEVTTSSTKVAVPAPEQAPQPLKSSDITNANDPRPIITTAMSASAVHSTVAPRATRRSAKQAVPEAATTPVPKRFEDVLNDWR